MRRGGRAPAGERKRGEKGKSGELGRKRIIKKKKKKNKAIHYYIIYMCNG